MRLAEREKTGRQEESAAVAAEGTVAGDDVSARSGAWAEQARKAGWGNPHNLPVRRTLTVLVGAAGTLAILAEFGFLVLYQNHILHSEAEGEASALAGSLSAKVVTEGDGEGAQRWASALALQPEVVAATFYNGGGDMVAGYRRAGAAMSAGAGVPRDGEHFDRDALTLARGVFLEGRSVGSVVVVYDLVPMRARIQEYFWIGVLALAAAILVRMAVARRMARVLTDPLLYLARVARKVSEQRDYSVRAERRTGGEIGQLIDAFNEMLAQIETRDRARRAAENELRESETRYALAARGSNDGLWDWKRSTRQIYFSARWNAILGEPEVERWETPEELFARIHPADRARVHAEFTEFRNSKEATVQIECRMRNSKGHSIWVVGRGVALRDEAGQIVRTAGSLTDITRFRTTDVVTALPNRIFFLDMLEAAVEEFEEVGTPVSVLFLELDHFKMVNDLLGHAASEELLAQLAGRLGSLVKLTGSEVVVARIVGDEFAVLLRGIEQDAEAVNVAGRTLELVREPFYLEGRRLPVSASIGIAFAHRGGTAEDLLRNAETAMYYASTKGRGQLAVFNRGMRERAVARLEVVTGLRRAIDTNQLRLHYQPIVSLSQARIIGFESLVRWQHPERGLIGPGEFVPIAEESDLIVALGEWVMREACRQMADWHRRLGPELDLAIGVNVSARQIGDRGFVEDVRRIVAESGLDPHWLRIEITESDLMSNSEDVIATMRALGGLGVRLVIDDFGTGYSSLSYLQRLPFNTLKIDRSFIQEIGAGDGSPEIVKTILQLAQSLRIKVVAEGVETAEQVTRLEELGCDFVQGFYFGQPISAEETEIVSRSHQMIRPTRHGRAELSFGAGDALVPESAPAWTDVD